MASLSVWLFAPSRSWSVPVWVITNGWVSTAAWCHNLELLVSPKVISGYPWPGRLKSIFLRCIPPSSPPARCFLCMPMSLACLRKHQVHQFFASVDLAEAVGKFYVVQPNSSWGFSVLQLHGTAELWGSVFLWKYLDWLVRLCMGCEAAVPMSKTNKKPSKWQLHRLHLRKLEWPYGIRWLLVYLHGCIYCIFSFKPLLFGFLFCFLQVKNFCQV